MQNEMMNYKETLNFLFEQLPMFHRIGAAAYKADLKNTVALLENVGNPQHKFPCIHIAGTNGKGSVSHFLAAIFQAAGLKTGLYISPHYKDFRERIKINGQYIPQKRVIDFVEKNRAAIENIQPSFFEMTVAMAFEHFAHEKVDIAVIEVGLGGRLDSTNVVEPLLSVITNISFDHVNLLGDTLPKIAFEKAGIIKPRIPVVVGEFHPETFSVFEKKAAETESEIFLADANFRVVETGSSNWETTTYDVFFGKEIYTKNLKVDAAGPFQAKNLATVFQAVEVLRQLDFFKTENLLSEKNVAAGLGNLKKLTRFIGRWQIIGERPTVLCDSAHNEAGIQLAFEKIETMQFKNLHIVTGFVNDKDISTILQYFLKSGKYYFAKANIPRGLDAKILKEKSVEFGLRGKAFSSVKNALRAARRASEPEDLVVVIGSIFVVAEVI